MDTTLCECELCGKKSENPEDFIWITHHYGVCEDCYNDMMPEEIDEIIEMYG